MFNFLKEKTQYGQWMSMFMSHDYKQFLHKNPGELECSKIVAFSSLKTEVKLGLISQVELAQPSAILQLDQKSVFLWILEWEDLFLLKNHGKLAFSLLQLKTDE